ncbi:MAG: AI-2E family transporter [Actinomycetota bacterium]|nr:AI-2E family transporter [Actinomycetota bacterium]
MQVRNLAATFGINLQNDPESPAATLVNLIQQLAGGILGLLRTVLFAVVDFIAAIFLALYLAARPEPVVGWTERLFPPDRRPRVHGILSEIRNSLLSWFKGKLLAMLIIGVLSTAALYLIGIPGALILGILSGLLEFVPYIGPILSVVLPALIGFVGQPIDALYVVLAYLAIQQVESNLVQPLIMRRAADVHPAVVITAVTLLGAVFGLLGALLAVPLTLVAGILVEELWFRRLEDDGGEDGTSSRPGVGD